MQDRILVVDHRSPKQITIFLRIDEPAVPTQTYKVLIYKNGLHTLYFGVERLLEV